MTQIDIYSGFLGAGKTTLIKKMLKEVFQGEKLVLIENEYGDVGVDGGFLQETGIQITEMYSGCICCSLVGDFGKALTQVINEYHPDRILIEPSGVGKLSDIVAAVEKVADENVKLGTFVTVADATKCKMYSKNFGEFYNNQIETASTIILSRTSNISPEKLDAAVSLLREHNPKATIITTPWEALTGAQILAAMEQKQTLTDELADMIKKAHHDHDEECDDPDCECHHHHHHDDDDEEHEHHHHHHHDGEECEDPDCECHHHHHDDDEEEHEHHHHHHHHDDEECDDPDCECHHHHDGEHEHHHHHHHHHADEVFTSWGRETPKKFSEDDIRNALTALDDSETYGLILRAKGIVQTPDGSWIHFDHVPGEINIRSGSADVTGRLCVIGSKINEDAIAALFGVE